MFEIIEEIASNNSKLHKEAVLTREAEKGQVALFAGLRMCYDPLITFGVKQVPEKKESDAAGSGLSWMDFDVLAFKLENRTLTGHAARDAIQAAMEQATLSEWNGWYRRILTKDMRAGFSESTVNKAVKKANAPGYAIPLFECQLAHDGANHESKVTGQKLIEVKLDGVRVITVVYPDGRVDQFSRNGRELANFPHIREQMSSLSQYLDEPFVFDGEVMSSSFQDLMRQVHRKTDVQSQDAVLYLFDWLSLKEFQAGIASTDQTTRSGSLRVTLDELEHVKILGQELVDLDTTEGSARFREINADAIRDGYEGIMIKDPSAPYECKRSTAWLKQKPFIEVSLSVVAVEEGTGKYEGKLGALVCEGEDDGRFIRVNVGSGFSDALRDNIWNARDGIAGNLVEVKADAVTQNQDGSYSLRFPRFKTFRGFEPGEKL
jgi:DNA ligase-1